MLRYAAILCLATALLLSPTAAAGPTVYDTAGTAQNSTIQYFPPRAGAGVVVDFDQFTSSVPGAPLPVAARIAFAPGTRWNGRRFPQCAVTALRARGPAACPPGSLFARGYVDVPPLVHHGLLEGFIATVGGHDAQLFWAAPGVVVVGILHTGRGSAIETIDLRGLPLIEQFHITDVRRQIDGIPLTVAPQTCPPRGWRFSVASQFAHGPALVSVNRQPCVGRSR